MSVKALVSDGVLRARGAQTAWRETPILARLEVVRRLRVRIASECLGLAAAVESNTHPLSEVLLSEVLPLLEAVRFLEKNAAAILRPLRLGKKGRPWWLGRVCSEVRREPFGVIAVISPSNYPLFLGGVQVLQALVAGNAVVWKPASGGAPVAGRLAQLAREAGLPEGILVVLPDTVEAGVLLLGEPIEKVVFTGGFENGTKVLEVLSKRAIPAVVELSGCDAVFVRADADLHLVAKALRFGLTFNQSRTCLAPRRVFVAGNLAQELEVILKRELSFVSEIQSANADAQWQGRCVKWVEEALMLGARLVHGEIKNGGIKFPCILANVPLQMQGSLGEFFAPILCITSVQSDDAALEAAARCEYALGAAVFSQDLQESVTMAGKIRAGLVSVNDLIVPSADPRIPFGGSGNSGYGVTRGAEGLLELSRIKVVQVRSGGPVQHLEAKKVDSNLAAALICLIHGGDLRARFRGLAEIFKLTAKMWIGSRKTAKTGGSQ